MEDQKQKVIDSLKQANNILVTVRNSPSIDQLAACIALTLIVNELGKHGTAVFSGHVPSTLEFLEPGKTLEPNTDSLRDFIISLDKSKADKLRYKVEDTVVKVFITPYRTSLSADDLEFSQGDFNVDVVVALGVHNQNDLDEAITAHGRILHDATVISLNTEGGGAEDLGSINWIDPNFSSLSEMVFSFADKLGKDDVIDNQVATALLTGIVAETGRFGNSKTKPQTMEVAAKLLAAGANQELVAAKLSEPEKPEELPHDSNQDSGGDTPSPSITEPPVNDNQGGELDIEHLPTEAVEAPKLPEPLPDAGQGFAQENAPFDIQQGQAPSQEQEDRPSGDPSSPDVPPIIDLNQQTTSNNDASNDEREALDYLKERKVEDNTHTRLEPLHRSDEVLEAPKIVPEPSRAEAGEPGEASEVVSSRFALTPPTMGGTLTANLPNNDEAYDSLLSDQKPTGPILSHDTSHTQVEDKPEPLPAVAPQPALDAAPLPQQPPESPAHEEKPQYTTLEELEKQVHAHQASDTANAKDMPTPAKLTLPTPQSASPTSSPSSTPLAPPPPVPPPLPSV